MLSAASCVNILVQAVLNLSQQDGKRWCLCLKNHVQKYLTVSGTVVREIPMRLYENLAICGSEVKRILFGLSAFDS